MFRYLAEYIGIGATESAFLLVPSATRGRNFGNKRGRNGQWSAKVCVITSIKEEEDVWR